MEFLEQYFRRIILAFSILSMILLFVGLFLSMDDLTTVIVLLVLAILSLVQMLVAIILYQLKNSLETQKQINYNLMHALEEIMNLPK